MNAKFATPLRVALWSGPRNLSTAMMRSFGARDDTYVVDEPFYAAFLAITGLDHPMRDAILAAHETNPEAVINMLTKAPAPAPIFYQKHMCHHMVDGIDRNWMSTVRHAFLIRHPARVLASYAHKVESASLEAIGFAQQAELFDHVTNDLGQPPIVIDSDDVLLNPGRVLTALCRAWGMEYSGEMLSWPKGYHPQDGVWARHWYNAVINSTGFAPPSKDKTRDLPVLSGDYADIALQALPYYEKLSQHKLKA